MGLSFSMKKTNNDDRLLLQFVDWEAFFLLFAFDSEEEVVFIVGSLFWLWPVFEMVIIVVSNWQKTAKDIWEHLGKTGKPSLFCKNPPFGGRGGIWNGNYHSLFN